MTKPKDEKDKDKKDEKKEAKKDDKKDETKGKKDDKKDAKKDEKKPEEKKDEKKPADDKKKKADDKKEEEKVEEKDEKDKKTEEKDKKVEEKDKKKEKTDEEKDEVEGKEKFAPEFVELLEPVYGDVGSPIHLSCIIEAEPKPTISWMKNGKKVGYCYIIQFLSSFQKLLVISSTAATNISPATLATSVFCMYDPCNRCKCSNPCNCCTPSVTAVQQL